MSFFDDASLVMIPSGYKDQKVYSVKPTDGTGDLTFSRASGATRVASNGLIEKVRTNLILQSEAFNTTWTPNSAPTITANTTIAPDGTLTADTIAATAGSSGVYQLPVVSIGVEYSFSLYVKNITSATNILIGCDLGPINANISFNAVTGAIIGVGASITGSSVTNAGNGWYRVAGTYVATGALNTFVIFGSSAMTFAAWGAQFETGVPTAYIPTTTAAVSVGPVSGLPRLDYTNSTCPRLLLEPQRTNLHAYSEQLVNTFIQAGTSVTSNTSISPSGYQDADTVTKTSDTGHLFVNTGGGDAGTIQTFSIYYKGTAGQSIVMNFLQGGGGIDAQKVVVFTGNWQRESITFTRGTGYNIYYMVDYRQGGTSTSFQAWGAQFESASYASSYIPTLAAQVTRVADTCSKTGISSLIGQSAGTVFIDLLASAKNSDDTAGFSLLASVGNTNRVEIYTNNGVIGFIIYAAATTVVLSSYTITPNQTIKVALGYSSGSTSLYVNGLQVASSAVSFSTSGLNDLYINQALNGDLRAQNSYNQALLFKTRLTNAQLAELTTI
jgi:hypothetical protein